MFLEDRVSQRNKNKKRTKKKKENDMRMRNQNNHKINKETHMQVCTETPHLYLT